MTGDGSIWRLHRVTGGPDGLGSSGSVPATDAARSERGVDRLSPREREVAALVSRGGSNRAIAEELYISAATVERHVANIMTKLGCHSRAQIAAWAVEHGLLHHRST
jgi:DNA-binding NarL/FixJ family response regulator